MIRVTIPIYVEATKRGGGGVRHDCRPAFAATPSTHDEQLGVALQRLRRRLKHQFDVAGGLARHDLLAESLFAPDFETHWFKSKLDLRESQPVCKFLWLVIRACGRRVATTPSLPGLWIDVPEGRSLEAHVRDVLESYFRVQERARQRGEPAIDAATAGVSGDAWITTITLEVNTTQASPKKLERQFAALFDDSKMDGAAELAAVGRCLDWLYPDDLAHGFGREREAEQLVALLEAPDNRPVVVVGPRLVGKTTIVHEAVRRRVAARKNPYAPRRNVWLLSPQRLVSGMSYVGQWEGRVQAILRHAARRNHILYFDDLLGLYRAGVSRDARHSIADVLKPYLLRRDVRLLSEMTPEAWHALQERDRGLADQFHVLRVGPTDATETRRVLLAVQRELEAEHAMSFDVAALPTLLRLHECYVRDAAFPGKAAAFARRLARKRARGVVGREQVLEEFHARTGMSLDLLDDAVRLERPRVVESLRRQIVGQDEAVEAAADVVLTAKTLLADPRRPLAVFLCLGPTGVGKTQCAKALAKTMFSDESRLVRFDMNEFSTPYAVARLVGTSDEPEGLLTAAVRRQPFCVVLLDEIEKAHPDVYDLLLQVTGEGRLTDAEGRTTDFTNVVLIMTSNLGASAGGGPLGLAPSNEDAHRDRYVREAERFFRPEFFNRLDRVLPFGALGRDEMRRIADLQLEELLGRDGFVRRRCALVVEPEALERIVDAGYHPQFGARALKRTLERQLVQPVAATLAAVRPDAPLLVTVEPSPDGVASKATPLEPVAPAPSSRWGELDAAARLAGVRRYLARVDAALAATPAATTQRGMSREQIRRYAVKEQWRLVRDLASRIEQREARPRGGSTRPGLSPKAAYSVEQRSLRRDVPAARWLRDAQSARDIHEYFRELTAEAGEPAPSGSDWDELRDETAYLHALETSRDDAEHVLIVVRSLVQGGELGVVTLVESLMRLVREWSYDVERLAVDPREARGSWASFAAAGPGIEALLGGEVGTHLLWRSRQQLQPIQVALLRLDERTSATEQLVALCRRQRTWLADRAAGRASEPPLPAGPAVRMYDESGPTVDLRTGLSFPHFPAAEEWRRLALARLPLPAELEV